MPDPTHVLALAAISGALLVGAISPGPSFVFVARSAAAGARRDGVLAAIGMGVGGAVFGTLALVGLLSLLGQVAWLYAGLRVLGGAYLLYLAVRIWRSAKEPLVLAMPRAAPRSTGPLLRGLAVQLSNPKTALVYASVFATLLPIDAPVWLVAALVPLIVVVEAGWYSLVATTFSLRAPREFYVRSKTWADRCAGALLGALGAKLVTDGATSA